VLQFLQHDGYIETARAFAEEMYSEKKSLSIDPNEVIEDINVKDDEHAAKRQREWTPPDVVNVCLAELTTLKAFDGQSLKATSIEP
jgi:hypothetical protein